MARLWIVFVTLLAVGSALAAQRSPTVRAEYQRAAPCPSTGRPTGPRPGWQVDHVVPLRCGGRDHPANLQWLTVEQHRAKTAREMREGCARQVDRNGERDDA